MKSNRWQAWVLGLPLLCSCNADLSTMSSDNAGNGGDCPSASCPNDAGTGQPSSPPRTGGGGGAASASSPGSFAAESPPSLIVTSGTAPSAAPDISLNRCVFAVQECNPDDAESCASDAYTSSNGGASGVTSSSGAGGSGGAGDAGSGGAAVSESSSAGGQTATSSSSRALACRVVVTNSVPTASCEPSGERTEGETCIQQSDCAAGHACTGEMGALKCRRYCCESDGVCPTGSYCAESVARDARDVGAVAANVWVCLPEEPCRFDEPFPCPANQTCSCPSGKTCGVVRSDGTTACVVPGAGLEGDSCSTTDRCAAGHVCSNTTGTCLKTCSLTSTNDRTTSCTSGICQSSASLPENVGICVSSAALD